MKKTKPPNKARSPFAIEPLESRQLLSASVIDLLIAYTTSAKTAAGSTQAIEAKITKSIADANQVLANSLVDITLRLVHTQEIAYTESGSLATDLARLQDPTDGFLDTLPPLRDAYGADLVSLFVANGDSAGLAYLMDDPAAPSNSDYAFSVIQQDSADAPNYTLIHEIGHNLGADHDRENASNAGAFDYSYGYRFIANGAIYRDVMSYDPGIRIPYFSNPNITYLGVPIGIAAGSQNSADTAATLNQTGPIAAAYRATVVSDSTAPTASISNWNFSTTFQVLSFSIKYTDESGLDTTSFGAGDIHVTGPNALNQAATFLGVDQVTPGGVRVATYQVSLGAGLLAQGVYTLTIQNSQIDDIFSNAMPTTILTLDTISPTATENAAGITSEIGPTYSFTVTYSDNAGIDLTTLDSSDLHVTGPFGFDHPATLLSIDTPIGGSVTATYEASSNYTSWDGAENATYSIVMQPNQVKDINGNSIAAGAIGSFDVAIAGGTFATALNLNTIIGARVILDSVDATDTTDFYKFTVGAPSNVIISLTGLSADANMLLVNDANENGNAEPAEILAFPNLAGILPETITTTLDPGTYHLWVYRVSGATTYSLAFSVIALPGTPTAAVSSTATGPGGTYSTFSVTYADDSAIKISTIDDADFLVTGPNGFSSPVTLLSVTSPNDGPLRGATYRVDAPGGHWDLLDNGAYSIIMQANQVSDTLNTFVAAGALSTFLVNLNDTSTPTASLTAPTIVNGTATSTFTITYSDNIAIKLTSLDSADIQITGPNSFSQTATFVGANQFTNGSPLIATYRLNAPGGLWDALDSGTYTISTRTGQIADTTGNGVAAISLGTFPVNIPDVLAPTASLTTASNLTSNSTNYTFTITYSDNVAINLSTLDSSDILITGPNGFSASATYVGANILTNGSPRIATYRIAGPGGAWDLFDNGAYSISLNNNQVADTTANFVPGESLGSFTVLIPDVAVPHATLSASNITSPGAATHEFTITYTDNFLIDISSLDSSDLTILAPDGSTISVTLVQLDSNINASTITATYSLSAPTGSFDSPDNGTYLIRLVAGQIADTSGNFVSAGSIGDFHVSINDIIPPTAIPTAANVITASSLDYSFTVTYEDTGALFVATFGNADILITGPHAFSQTATFVSVDDITNGSSRTVTYKFTPPGGSWNFADNGTYTLGTQALQISDINNNFMAAESIGQFTVAIPDTTPPKATLKAAKVTKAGARSYTFKVIYTDNAGLLASSIGNGDVKVWVKNGFSQLAKLVSKSTSSNSKTITATYKITPPGGTWNRADNKKYNVTLLPNQILDINSNFALSKLLGTFTVIIP
ncbi:MAG TPA: M12 family metallo-peptidase [Tepidisphaeraceae bacterium]|nr:M12 family metallo-peptidase [Tepidisphaeraceae bacterium]